MVQYCKTKAKNVKGGQLCLHLNAWQRVTSDKNTDSSDIGWGVVFKNKRTGGPWEEVEVKSLHINIREMLAVYFAIRYFREMFRDIEVHSDNTTTVQFINKMGSTHSIECNSTINLEVLKKVM